VLVVAVLAALGLLAVRASRRQEYVELARRRLLIGAVLGAASFVGACRRLGAERPSAAAAPTRLSVLARLGEIWRAMSRHASGAIDDSKGFEALEKEMGTALQELKAQADKGQIRPATAAALDTAFRERYFHIRRTRHIMATCYDMSTLGVNLHGSRAAVEEQVKILNELKQSRKLPPEAAAKARAVLAKEVAFQTRVAELQKAAQGQGEQAEAARAALRELDAQYGARTIEATKASTEAAQTLVGFTTKRS
jgi:hypothetical protein